MTIPVHDKRSRIVVYPFYNGNTRISRGLWTIRTSYDLQANVSRLNRFILPCNYTFLSRILVADVETFSKHRTYVTCAFCRPETEKIISNSIHRQHRRYPMSTAMVLHPRFVHFVHLGALVKAADRLRGYWYSFSSLLSTSNKRFGKQAMSVTRICEEKI